MIRLQAVIFLNGRSLVPYGIVVDIALQNYNSDGNTGVIIVDDELFSDEWKVFSRMLVGFYNKSNDEVIDNDFTSYINDKFGEYTYVKTKLDMENASIGMKVIFTFIGLYLGIIFAISSATILAIGQLSEASDNKIRYRILKQIGADEIMVKKSLFTQIAIAFLLPLVVALFHAFFGLRELNGVIEVLGNVDLTSNIFFTTIFIVMVYGGYFMATYLCGRMVLKD